MASSWYDIWAVATVGWVAFMVITPWLTKRDWRHFRISLLLLIVAIVAMGVLATIEAIQLWNSFLWFL
jgi:hypothetical protein